MPIHSLEQLFGYSEQELLGQTPTLLRSGRHSPEFYEQMWHMLEQQHYWQGEVVNRRKDGESLPLQLSISAVFNEQQQVSHYAAIFTDLSQIRATEAEMAFLADHDELTHLPNRHLFLQLVEQAIKVARRDSAGCAVLVLDLDHFKRINDSYGHGTGDWALKKVVEVLKPHVRNGDVFARIGGEEFALFLPYASESKGMEVAEQCRSRIEAIDTHLSGHKFTITASFGVSGMTTEDLSLDPLLHRADMALYAAKSNGRNSVFCYEDALASDKRATNITSQLARQ